MPGTTIDRLRESLSATDYPAHKDALVAEATRAGADVETIRALRSIPPVEYANFTEVARSTPMDPELEDGHTDAEQAKARRQRTGRGLSEQHTDTPNNPIVEELGENRGS